MSKLTALGLIIGVVLVAFVSVWVYLASQGAVPSVGGQLEDLSWPVRFGGLVALAAILGGLYAVVRRQSDR